jgi:hypothetical protein
LHENNVGVATLVETNTAWNKRNHEEATTKARQATNNILLSETSSSGTRLSDYQPWGSACLLTNNVTGYNIKPINDTRSLGRLTGFKLKGKEKQTIVVFCAYKPTPSSDINNFTCYSKQWRILRENKDVDPKTREVIINDLLQFVKQWETQKLKIIIGVDMNKACTHRLSKVRKLMDKGQHNTNPNS